MSRPSQVSPPSPVRGSLASPGARPAISPRHRRHLVLALLSLAVLTIALVLVVTDPFGAAGSTPGGPADNGLATSLATVAERSLSAQTQVSGTLGYAGGWTIRVPEGTTPAAVRQAQGSVSSARRILALAGSTLAADQMTLVNAQARLVADQQQLAVDCAGDGAAQSASSTTQTATGSSGGGCATDAQLVSADRQTHTQAESEAVAAQRQVSTAGRSLDAARSQLSNARARETAYGQASVITGLPRAGGIVAGGQQLCAIDGKPVLLLYGSVLARRAFVPGMSSGLDVAELNANLDALGYAHDLIGDSFTVTTSSAVRALQRAHGMVATGTLLLGSVVFAPGAVRVKNVIAGVGVGALVAPGPLLTVSSTRRVVTIQLDAALEGQVKDGDPVIIALPDNATTPGRISYVSRVATTGQDGTTVAVHVTPDHPRATGTLDQAPVNVQITAAHVSHALVVPVDALLALAGGGYAVEEVSGGRHHLLAVHTGLFDDADGLVQISGAGLAAGQRVVVPGS